jgi:hypothetical protein
MQPSGGGLPPLPRHQLRYASTTPSCWEAEILKFLSFFIRVQAGARGGKEQIGWQRFQQRGFQLRPDERSHERRLA